MRFDLTINEFVKTLFLNKTLDVYDADTWRPYCHVRDFAKFIEITLNSDKVEESNAFTDNKELY